MNPIRGAEARSDQSSAFQSNKENYLGRPDVVLMDEGIRTATQ